MGRESSISEILLTCFGIDALYSEDLHPEGQYDQLGPTVEL